MSSLVVKGRASDRADWVQISTSVVGRQPLCGDTALDNLACDVGDKRCKLVFDSGLDVKESSHTGGAASELLGGFTLVALALCRDILDVLVVGFLSKPDGMLALVD